MSYLAGVAITPNSPSSAGGAVDSYAAAPALPPGLTLDTTSGIITGTPTTLSSVAPYVVTGTNTGGSTTVSLSIAVLGRCGDSLVSIADGEQCDHGANNGTVHDSCSATCQLLTGTYFNELEPNDSQATGNDLDGYAGGVGQLNPATEVDWYTVDVTVPGSSITAELGDGSGGCTGLMSQLALYSPTGVVLATDTAGGVAPCSKIAPTRLSGAANLPVGKYALKVENVGSVSSLPPYYVLTVHVAPPGCGDGILQAGEQCDPVPPVNGCSATTCQLTGDFNLETEPNDTQATANVLGTHAGFIGAIQPVGDLDYFSFAVPGPSSLVFITTSDGVGSCPLGFDSVLTLYDPSGNVLVQDDNGAGPTSTCSSISPATHPSEAMNLPAGTYRTRVEFKGDNSTQSLYVLNIAVKQPGCGDSVVEASEQCDDGPANGTAGDGCTATCQSLPPWELEPNGSLATATPQWSGLSTWKGAVNPIGDHDFYSFTLAAPGSVTLTTHDPDAPTACSFDTFIHLLDHTGTELSSDDDTGPGPGDPSGGKCSKISNDALPAGTFYVLVQRYNDTKTIAAYQLDLSVQ